MQSRILLSSAGAATYNVTRKSSSWVALPDIQLLRGLASISAGRTADPAVHSGNYDAEPAANTEDPNQVEGPDNVTEEEKSTEEDNRIDTEIFEGAEPLSPPKRPSYAGSPKLEKRGIEQPVGSNYQQKRSLATAAGGNNHNLLKNVSCAGLDGSPWAKDNETDRDEQQMDEQQYYKHHKVSPLSEIEVADTRKPFTRATDGTADAKEESDVIGWKPEQLETAEETMERAARIWKENAMCGIPDDPQSRALRLALRAGGELGDSIIEYESLNDKSNRSTTVES